MNPLERLKSEPAASVFPLLSSSPHALSFVTVAGSHALGFDTPESDYDLRGMHVASVREVLALDDTPETWEAQNGRAEIVTHDVRKFFRLLLRKDVFHLEQIFSPHIVVGRSVLAELRPIASRCITCRHADVYLHLARREWQSLTPDRTKPVKRLLYVFRWLLSGIVMMQQGVVETNLRTLNSHFRLEIIDALLEAKSRNEIDRTPLELVEYRLPFESLSSALLRAADESNLPEYSQAREDLNRLLYQYRMETLG